MPNPEGGIHHYDLWRRCIGNASPPSPPGAWEHLTDVYQSPTPEFIDFGAPGIGGPNIARYRVRAVTSLDLLSVFSDSVSINWGAPMIGKPTATPQPKTLSFSHNSPNPFNPTTTISFDLTEPSMVSLIVYDMLGRKIEGLADGLYLAGSHSVTWNATDQASGVYFARCTATSAEGKPIYSKVNKLVLLR